MKKNYLKSIAICALGMLLTNCEGEDGINGINGLDGENGIDGIAGINGENGVGFDELTQFGSITITFEGIRPDDVAFLDTAEFKYTAIEGDQLDENSSVEVSDSEISFDAVRFLSAPDDVYQETLVELDLDITNPGQDDEAIDFSLEVDDYAIISDDFKYVVIDDGEFSNTDAGVTNFVITNYSFNEDTHNLVFSFSFDVAGDSNETGNDLSISGEVDIIVLEEVP
ncbi:hypothetical protein [Aquimarina mytili]|uniref:Collagen-like protein n=1 Tax=Aquimarina mytili TaxID=874423 RepID=A0A937D5V5_9FLAO|nr:hypothetical protein [Aquimarina mytili]MBL0683709.1 hypothetical protein [Aquimarina mytili]